MNNLNVKKGDNVLVLTGKDKGKTGTIVESFPKDGRISVEGVNVNKKHTKPRSAQAPGGIIEQIGTIDVSNVMIICPKCKKATRVANTILADGKKIRTCKKCKAELTSKLDEKATAKEKKAKKSEQEEK